MFDTPAWKIIKYVPKRYLYWINHISIPKQKPWVRVWTLSKPKSHFKESRWSLRSHAGTVIPRTRLLWKNEMFKVNWGNWKVQNNTSSYCIQGLFLELGTNIHHPCLLIGTCAVLPTGKSGTCYFIKCCDDYWELVEYDHVLCSITNEEL